MVKTQELLNAFCDASISLVSDTSDEDVRLACSLPNATVLQHITTTIFTHLSHSEHKFSSSLVCLRTLACLFTHHYGFYFIKKFVLVASIFFYEFYVILIVFVREFLLIIILKNNFFSLLYCGRFF